MDMKLYWADAFTQLYQGDARNLNLIPDRSVDMIIADVPYGIQYVTGHRVSESSVVATNRRFVPIESDDHFPLRLLKDSLYEMLRVLKPNRAVYIFTRWDIYPRLLPLVNEVFTVRNLLVWAKNNWSAGSLEDNYAYQYELIVFAVKLDEKGDKFKLRGERPTNVLPFKRVDGAKLQGPAEKPTSLLSFLINKSTDPGDIVLDPFCGTGSTLVAASDTGRKSIGVDIEEKWLKITKKKLERRLLPLFETAEVGPQNFELFYEGDEQ